MKKIIISGVIIVIIGIIIGVTLMVKTNESKYTPVNIYIFRGEGCPHCEKAMAYFENLEKNTYKNKIKIIDKEIWYNQNNQALLNKVTNYFQVTSTGVPFIVVGNQYFVGYTDEIAKNILKQIDSELKMPEPTDIVKGL